MPKTVIFANGKLNNPAQYRRLIHSADYIICADGGTRHALAMGLTPHLIVGDLDSLSEKVVAEMEASAVQLERHPAHKDQTDLELALQTAIKRGAKEILLLGLLGGRLDQHLANILLLARPEWASALLWLAEDNQRALLLRGPAQLNLPGLPGDTLSILPLSDTISGLSLNGVAWPLEKATVSLGSTLTISNQFAADQAKIQLEKGIALITQIRRRTEDEGR